MRPRTRLAISAFVGVAGVIAALGLCELGLRVFWPQPLYGFEKGLFVSDELVGYRLARHKVAWHKQPAYSYDIRTNSLGFRGPEPNLRAQIRVIVVGDSFAFGQGVADERTFIGLIRARLAKSKADADVLNASAPGYSLPNEVGLLRELVPSYKPNIVIALFTWNDFGVHESLKVKDGYLVSSDQRLGPLREYLNSNVHLYALIKRAYYTLHDPDDGPSTNRHATLRDTLYTVEQLLAMKQICDDQAVLFRVLVLPIKVVGRHDSISLQLKADVFSLLRAYGIPHVDLEQFMVHQSWEARQALIFSNDGHWNEEGHRYFAEHIAQLLQEWMEQLPKR